MRFIEGFLAPAVAQNWLVQLENSDWVEWQRETFSIFGRQVEAPRTLSWFGDAGLNYRYTGIDHCAVGWPEPLQRLKGQVEMTAGQSFNFLLLNRYADGCEYMGWHRDDEHGCRGDIASLSLGAPRRFSIDQTIPQHQGIQQTQRQTLALGNGSLLVFDGRQRHCLRATKKSCGVRINLTFRLIGS